MQGFQNLSIRIKTLVSPILILLLMAIVATIAYNGVNISAEREADVALTHEIKFQAAVLMEQFINMETGERGFLITGDESFLDPYNEGITNYTTTMENLRSLIKDEAQLAELAELDALVTQWRSEVIDPLIELRRAVNVGQADYAEIEAIVASRAGKNLADQMRAKINDFQAFEEELLAQRAAESENSALWLKGTLIGGTLFAILIGLVVSLWIASSISRRIGLVAGAAAGMADGRLEEQYDLPSGQDEVGQMAGAFAHMAARIRNQIEEQKRANDELRAANDTRVAKEYLESVVRDYSNFATEVARGNLSARLSINGGNDELTELGRNLNHMVEGLHEITLQTQQASANIAASAAEILAATTQQASSAAEQSSAITQTSTTIEEVKAIALQTAQQAAQVAEDSQTALTAARQGTASVEETVNGMNEIRRRVESIAQTILALSEQTQAIGSIITTVSELADQSNLLALNAAIEAARAGEQGKSFAVVAQHVRDLAERSKRATQQVRDILSEIQRATNAAVLVTEEGTKGVESGTQLAGQAGEIIHRIAGEVEVGAQANVQMAAAAQQQTAGMDQIGQAMGSIQQATTQTLASTRQAERAAQDLHSLAQSLQKTIAAYKL
jgi:methyl-accepting chemotaxis protein